jgi:hypothetical protein
MKTYTEKEFKPNGYDDNGNPIQYGITGGTVKLTEKEFVIDKFGRQWIIPENRKCLICEVKITKETFYGVRRYYSKEYDRQEIDYFCKKCFIKLRKEELL